MVHSSWGDVWRLALGVFAGQRIEVRILIGLLAAFLALMVIEGLRASFFPKRHETPATPEPEERIVFISKPPSPEAMALPQAPPQSFAARRANVPPPNPKRAVLSVRRHKPTRPIIRREANGAMLAGDQEVAAQRGDGF